MILSSKEAVQQFKIDQKRKVDSALNPKRSKILGSKNNCGTASKVNKKRVKMKKEELLEILHD